MSLRRTQGVRQDAGLFRPTAPPSSYLRGGCPRRVFSKGGPMHISPTTPSLPNTGLPTCALPKRTEKRRTPRPTRLRLAPSRPPTLSSRKNSPSPPGPRRAPRLAPRRRALRASGGGVGGANDGLRRFVASRRGAAQAKRRGDRLWRHLDLVTLEAPPRVELTSARGGNPTADERTGLAVLDSSFHPPTRAHETHPRRRRTPIPPPRLAAPPRQAEARRGRVARAAPREDGGARRRRRASRVHPLRRHRPPALVVDKAAALRALHARRDGVRIIVLVGFDTWVRIVEPKYYTPGGRRPPPDLPRRPQPRPRQREQSRAARRRAAGGARARAARRGDSAALALHAEPAGRGGRVVQRHPRRPRRGGRRRHARHAPRLPARVRARPEGCTRTPGVMEAARPLGARAPRPRPRHGRDRGRVRPSAWPHAGQVGRRHWPPHTAALHVLGVHAGTSTCFGRKHGRDGRVRPCTGWPASWPRRGHSPR